MFCRLTTSQLLDALLDSLATTIREGGGSRNEALVNVHARWMRTLVALYLQAQPVRLVRKLLEKPNHV